MKKLVLMMSAAGALLFSSAAMADDGDDYAFKLVNQSKATATILTTILTNGKWSNNWLSTPLSAGQTRALRFNAASNDTRCEIRTRVAFSDGSEFDTTVNYCGTESVILTDQNLYVK